MVLKIEFTSFNNKIYAIDEIFVLDDNDTTIPGGVFSKNYEKIYWFDGSTYNKTFYFKFSDNKEIVKKIIKIKKDDPTLDITDIHYYLMFHNIDLKEYKLELVI